MNWVIVAFLTGLYCFGRGLWDIRCKRYAWGVLGMACGLALLLVPAPDPNVRFDFSAPTAKKG